MVDKKHKPADNLPSDLNTQQQIETKDELKNIEINDNTQMNFDLDINKDRNQSIS